MAIQKFREEFREFVAEGSKIATEWLSSGARVNRIVATSQWLSANEALVNAHPEAVIYEASDRDIAAVSQLTSPPAVLLVVPYPQHAAFDPAPGWYIALDGIQDPGNLGTIIRIADWFGISDVLCSENCVDAFNHKVIQGAMGSHLRVRIHKVDLVATLAAAGLPLYAATLSGHSIYEESAGAPGVLVVGSEGRGVSAAVLELPVQEITLPRIGGAESLNAAVSTGILCSWLVRR